MERHADSFIVKKLINKDVSNIYSDVKMSLSGKGHADLAREVLFRIHKLFLSSSPEAPLITEDCVQKLVCVCCQSIYDDFETHEAIPSNSKIIVSLYNILHRLYSNLSILCSVHVIESCLPILEKMILSMSEADLKVAKDFPILLYRLMVDRSDDILKDPASAEKQSMLSLWKLLLRMCLLFQVHMNIPFNFLRVMLSKYISQSSDTNCEIVCNVTQSIFVQLEQFCQRFSVKYQLTDSTAEDFFSTIIVSLKILIKYYNRGGHYKAADVCVKSFTQCIGFLFKLYPNYIQYWDLAVGTFHALVLPLNKPVALKNVKNEIDQCFKNLQNFLKRDKCKALALIGCLCGALTECSVNPSKADDISLYDTSLIVSLYKFCKLLAELILSSSSSCCPVSPKQKVTHHDFLASFNLLTVPARIIFDIGKSDEKLYKLLEDNLQSREMVLNAAQDHGCQNVESISRIFYEHVYYVGYLFEKGFNLEKSIDCMRKALSYFLVEWEKKDSCRNPFPKCHIFSLLVSCYEKLGRYSEARAAILLPVVLHSHINYNPDPFLCRIWCKLQDKDFEHARTSVNFVRDDFKQIQSLLPSISRSKCKESSMLLWELNCYAVYRISNVKPVLLAWEAFQTLNMPQLLVLKGAVLAFQALLSIGNCTPVIFNQLSNLDFSNIKQDLRKEQQCEALCLLASFTEYQALFLALKNANESTKSFKKSPILEPASIKVEKPEDVPNPNDSCSVVIRNLSLLKEAEIIALLDLSVKYWEEAFCEKLSVIEEATLDHYGEVLIQTAFMYSLFGHLSSAARTWNICRKFASKSGRDNLHLQALCGLMNLVECKPTWIAEADSLSLKILNHPRSKYLLLLYHTSRAFHALRTRKYEEGLSFLTKIRKDPPTLSSLWCQIYARLVCASYTLLPGYSKVSEQFDFDNPVSLAQSGLAYAVDEFKKHHSAWLFPVPIHLCAIVDQLCSVSLWLGRIFCQIKQPRQARVFLKTELEITQKLGLATRASEFLCELAQVDLICDKYDDAKLKVMEVNSILGLTPTETTNTVDMNLMKKSKSHVLQELSRSPSIFKEQIYIFPSEDHPVFCDCKFCSNSTIQLVSLLLYKIQARVLTLQWDVHQAYRLYKSGVKLFHTLEKRLQKDKRIPGSLLLYHQVICALIAMRIEYADMLTLYEKDAEACRQNHIALSLIGGLNTSEVYLSAEAGEQKLCLLQTMLDKEKGSSTLAVPNRSNVTTPEKNIAHENVRTPVNEGKLTAPLCPGKRKPLYSVSTPKQEPSSSTPLPRTPLQTISTPNKDASPPEVNFDVKSVPSYEKRGRLKKENQVSSVTVSRKPRASRKKNV